MLARLLSLTIQARLGLALAPPVVLLLLTAGSALWRLDGLHREFNGIVVDRQERAELVNAIIVENHALLRSAQATLLADGAQAPVEAGSIGAAKRRLDALLERLDLAFRDETPAARAMLQSVHTMHSSYLVDLVRFTRLVEGGRAEEARALLNARLRVRLEEAFAAMRTLGVEQTRVMRASVAAAADTHADARRTTIAFAVLSVLIATLVAMAAARSIARPLGRAVEVAERVAAGNLTSRIEAGGRGEAGLLMTALKSMNGALADIVRDARAGSDTIARASGRLVAANEDLAQRTTAQAASLQEAAGAMQQFTASAVRNAEGAGRAAELASGMEQVATRGEESVRRMVDTMGAIRGSSGKIGDIVAFIDRVSFQTHMLALNAAVEAARAGAAGRGFAVIAEEVRELASRSAAAARDVRALVQESAAEIAKGSALAGETGRTMHDVLDAARAVAAIMGEISAASTEQRSGIEEMNVTLAGMDQATQRNAGLVEEVSGAMRLLEDEARRMVELVRVFDLGDRDAGVLLSGSVETAQAATPTRARTARRLRVAAATRTMG